MAKADIGPKIGIEGEREFKRQIKEINGNLKELASETNVVTSEFIGNEHSVEALTASNRQLGETSAALSSKIEILRARLDEYAQAGQLSSDAAQKLQIDLNNTTAAYNTNEAQIKANNEEIQKLTDAEGENAETVGGLGGLLRSFGVDLDGVAKSLGLSKEQTSALSEAMGGGGMSLAVGAAAAAAAVTLAAAAIKEITEFMAEAVREATDYADNISTLSTNFHIAADTLQEYQYMAELTDTSLDTITGSISKLTRSMDKARDGNAEVDASFAALNVRVTDANGELRDASEVFLDVIDGLGRIHNETERDAISMSIFGRSAMELNNLIATGSAGIRGFAEEARAMGYVLSNEEVNTLRQLNDEFARFDNQMTAIKNQIAAEMAPALIELAQQLLEVAQSVDWEQFGKSAATIIKDLTPLIVNLTKAVASAADALASLMEQVDTFRNSDAGRMFAGGFKSAVGTLLRANPITGGVVSAIDTASGVYRAISGAGSQPIVVQSNISLNDQTLGRAVTPVINARNAQRGNVF